MGDFAVKPNQTNEDRTRFLQFLIRDIQALDLMIKEDVFEKGKQRIGAEQELCLVDESWNPSIHGLEVLDRVGDPHVTTELARFNLEINLDPFELRPDCFRRSERQLLELLGKTKSAASDFGAHVLLAGILPTLRYGHVQPEWMTPIARYKLLSQIVKAMRGSDFEINIQGVDELITSLDSVLFEACNTSFQTHLQIPCGEFVPMYNWAQMIAAPVLAACANSPLLLGRELWMETRIALFQQSVDSRSSANHLSDRESRVRFGTYWIRDSISELYKDHVARFPLILTTDTGEDAVAEFNKGKAPALRALRLHNGTVYAWNRPCYGLSDGMPHLRIENRYLPAGPSVADEMANFAFWVGLMKGLPRKWKNLPEKASFRAVKSNFYRVAKTGLDTVIDWFGKPFPAQELIRKRLLPVARAGLESANINASDIDRYLDIIEQRVAKRRTGALWQVRNYRHIREVFNSGVAVYEITQAMLEFQASGKPVHTWSDIDIRKNYPIHRPSDSIRKIMSTDLFTVGEDEPLSLVKSIMEWKKIRHLPVENKSGDLVGLVTATNVKAFPNAADLWQQIPIKRMMVKELITITVDTPVRSAKALMETYGVGCLPVTHNNKLIGIVTDTDIKRVENILQEDLDEM